MNLTLIPSVEAPVLKRKSDQRSGSSLWPHGRYTSFSWIKPHALRLCCDPGQGNKPSQYSAGGIVLSFTASNARCLAFVVGFGTCGWFDTPASKARGASHVCVC